MEKSALVHSIAKGSGIWDGERSSSHAFQLSTDVWQLSAHQVQELNELGSALGKVLAGAGRIATIAAINNLGRSEMWRMIHRMAVNQIPNGRKKLQEHKPSSVPFLYRVDMVPTMDGGLKIVEIEGDKTHGFGYCSLTHALTEAQDNGSSTLFPGVASTLAAEVKRRRKQDPTLMILEPVGDPFYRPEMDVLCARLEACGIQTIRIKEECGGTIPANALFLALPHLCGSKHQPANTELHRLLCYAYLAGNIQVLIPPKPFLSSKALMALVMNGNRDEDLEAVLRSQIDADSLATVRAALPATMFVTPHTIVNGGSWVLKQVHSSGARGVSFSWQEDFDHRLTHAQSQPHKAILQQVVESPARSYAVYSQYGRYLSDQDRYARVAVFFSRHGVADIAVTACSELPVHGGKEAVMVGCVQMS